MFERMTESARRTIFHARKEASEQGLALIGSEHLLYGVMCEDEPLFKKLAGPNVEIIRHRLAFSGERHQDRQRDLPLGEEAKLILRSTAEEADRLGDWMIGTEHLLAGFLLVPDCAAAKILSESGLTLEAIRNELKARPR